MAAIRPLTPRIDRGLAQWLQPYPHLLLIAVEPSKSTLVDRLRRVLAPSASENRLGRLAVSALGMTYGLRDLNSSATLGSTLRRLAGHVTEYAGLIKLVNVDIESAQYAVWHGMGLVL